MRCRAGQGERRGLAGAGGGLTEQVVAGDQRAGSSRAGSASAPRSRDRRVPSAVRAADPSAANPAPRPVVGVGLGRASLHDGRGSSVGSGSDVSPGRKWVAGTRRSCRSSVVLSRGSVPLYEHHAFDRMRTRWKSGSMLWGTETVEGGRELPHLRRADPAPGSSTGSAGSSRRRPERTPTWACSTVIWPSRSRPPAMRSQPASTTASSRSTSSRPARARRRT